MQLIPVPRNNLIELRAAPTRSVTSPELLEARLLNSDGLPHILVQECLPLSVQVGASAGHLLDVADALADALQGLLAL